jgi:hypothetical protein
LQGGSTINTYTDGPYSVTQGGSIGISINQSSINLPATAVYTLQFNTTIDTTNATSVAYATDLKATVITTSTTASASVTSITNTLLGAASLASATTPTGGNNDDGYWTLTLPFNITYLGTSYSTIYVGTNHYVTFTSGSLQYTGLGPATPNLPKIMWCCDDNSVQRIYYGVEGTGSGTYTVTNSGASAYTINSSSNPTLTLQRGGTYTFNVSASGHPFWIQTVSGAYSSGNLYNTGVTSNGTQIGTITFTVPNDAPATLYYVCQLHSSMRGTINIVAGTRTYRVRTEGTTGTSGTVGSPTMVNEWIFYEAFPTRIDLQCGANAKKTTGTFTTNQLNAWGFIASQRIPLRVASCDADVRTAMNEGIIFVGAAGNGLWKHDIPGGIDWDNTFEMGIRYPASVAQPYYTHRGTSPTANDTNMPNICVGAVDANSTDQKSYYSDCGPGVDIWAPGTNIISSYLSGASDSRNTSYFFGKINGTSMASPQVCGVLACALEVYPNMTQAQAKAYILGIAKANQLTVTSGGPADIRDTQGTANLFLYYRPERDATGNVSPKINYQVRPSSGAVYPRTRMRKYG